MFQPRRDQQNRAPVIKRAIRGDMAPPPDPPLMPPPLAPASSYHTANTHAPTEADESTQRSTQEDGNNPGAKAAEPADPFEGLWGKLVPCNSAMETIDLCSGKAQYTVGRSTDADIFIAHPKISSRHCELRNVYNANGTTTVTVVDFSTNGTYVNGIRLGRGRHSILNHGDELSLGVPVGLTNDEDFRFIFRSRITAIERGGGIHAQYSFGAVLGTGSFATVRRAICKCTGQHYAVKIIAKSKLVNNPKTLQMLDRELSILRDLKHYNITKIKEYYQDESTLFIVMELVEGGDLLDRIINSPGGISEEQARELTAEMVDAIQYTHRKKIMHRDLKPENVLLTTATPEHPNGRVKVADFGLAKSMADGTYAKTMCGTPAYLAPEVVLNGSQPYDFKVDCWSLGVIVWAMLTNTACFPEDDNLSLIERFQNRYVSWDLLDGRGLSDDCIDFMQKMIVNDPRLRMSITDARNHPWLRGIRNDPPADWTASQSQPSQYAGNFNASQSEIYTTEYRGRTPAFEPGSRRPTPKVSAENLRHAEEEITTPMETEDAMRNGAPNGYRGVAGFDGSGVSSEGGSRYDSAPHTAEPMGESKFSLDSESAGSADPFSELRMSQRRMEDLKIEDANGDGETAYGGGEDENDGSFVQTSVGTPPHLKKEEMDIDGSSWENVQAPAVDRISPPNGATTTNGTRRASGRGKVVRRDVTPTRAAAPVPPTTQKRKAAATNFDGDSSELSSPPPEDAPEIAERPAKTPRTSANGRAGATRSAKKAPADAAPASKTPTARKAPRKSGRGYRAPSDSEDEEDGHGRAGPSTSRKAASPATAAPRRSTRNAHPPPNKAPRLR